MRLLTNRRKTGEEYEKIVAKILEKYGYQILERNYRCRIGEIDLIAIDQGMLVFIEVKYRKDKKAGRPEEAVNVKKQQIICRTADDYRMRYPQYAQYQIRFDVAAVLENKLRIYKNAFEYQWRRRWN